MDIDKKTDISDSLSSACHTLPSHPEELREKYHRQLDYYAKALERLTGKKVKEKIIYSFALGQEMSI